MLLEFQENTPLEDQLCSDNIYQEVNFDIDDDEIFIKDYSNKRMEEDVKVLLNDLAEIVSAQESSEEKNDFIKDSLGRVYCRTPHTGPGVIGFRPQKYQKSDIVAHLTDLESVVRMKKRKGKNAVMLIADGSPDLSKTSMLNIYYYHKFCRKHELDMLTITSYAAGFSAYNSIEKRFAKNADRLTLRLILKKKTLMTMKKRMTKM